MLASDIVLELHGFVSANACGGPQLIFTAFAKRLDVPPAMFAHQTEFEFASATARKGRQCLAKSAALTGAPQGSLVTPYTSSAAARGTRTESYPKDAGQSTRV